MDANELQLLNYKVKQVVRFGTDLQVHNDWQVTFNLGTHGPFTLIYDHQPEQTELQRDIGKIGQTIRAGAQTQV